MVSISRKMSALQNTSCGDCIASIGMIVINFNQSHDRLCSVVGFLKHAVNCYVFFFRRRLEEHPSSVLFLSFFLSNQFSLSVFKMELGVLV